MHSPAALRRAALHGDALLALDRRQPPSLPTRLRCCERQWSSGRSGPDFRIAKRVYIAVDDDTARGGQRTAAALDSFTDTLASCGIPTAHRALFGAPRMIGAGMVLPNSRRPHSSSTDLR